MPNFKAIIVGGGPVGLFTAHLLDRAGIDYVLFEKRPNIVENQGGGLVLWSNTVRLFHQLGLLDRLQAMSTKLRKIIYSGPDGKTVADTDFWDSVVDNHGYPCLLFERADVLQLLLETLPNHEEKIKTGKRVSGYTNHASGVVVAFDDGTTEEGSILIGADGVWSKVRQGMTKPTEPQFPYVSSYNAVFGRAPAMPALAPGYMVQRQESASGIGFNLFPANDHLYFIAYRTCEDTKEYVRFTEKDAELFVADFLDAPIVNGITLRDIWENREASAMTQLHHGMVKTWSADRVVLVGDNVHKVTPNSGAGANNGFESAASLVNHLHALLQSDPEPITDSLSNAFAQYQAERQERAAKWVQLSVFVMRSILWVNTIRRFIFLHVQPLVSAKFVVQQEVSPLLAKGTILDFVPFREAFVGKWLWNMKPVV